MTETSNTKLSVAPLGKNGPLVSRLGLGCMGFSAFYGTPVPDEIALPVLNRSLDLGCTHLDTADLYGDNELLLAQLLETRRNEVFLASKFGASVQGEGMKERFGESGGNPEYVRVSIERSLKRLNVSTIDLYYQHRMDSTTPIEDTMRTLAELVKEGKIRYIGLSECSGETLRRAYAVHPVAAVQWEYSPWAVDIETNGLLAACRELGVALVAYSPLARGFLSGKFKSINDFEENDVRRSNPRFQGDNFAKNYRLVEEFNKLAQELGHTPSQVVLAWLLAQGNDIFVIPGTTNQSRLEENLVADKIVLSEDSVNRIRDIIQSIEVFGGRKEDVHLAKCNI